MISKKELLEMSVSESLTAYDDDKFISFCGKSADKDDCLYG